MDGEDDILFLHRAVFPFDVPCLPIAIHFDLRSLIELSVLDSLRTLAGRIDPMPRHLIFRSVLGHGETGDQAALLRLFEVRSSTKTTGELHSRLLLVLLTRLQRFDWLLRCPSFVVRCPRTRGVGQGG